MIEQFLSVQDTIAIGFFLAILTGSLIKLYQFKILKKY